MRNIASCTIRAFNRCVIVYSLPWDTPHNMDTKFQAQTMDIIRERKKALAAPSGRKTVNCGN